MGSQIIERLRPSVTRQIERQSAANEKAALAARLFRTAE
jgi:hypothetical protein